MSASRVALDAAKQRLRRRHRASASPACRPRDDPQGVGRAHRCEEQPAAAVGSATASRARADRTGTGLRVRRRERRQHDSAELALRSTKASRRRSSAASSPGAAVQASASGSSTAVPQHRAFLGDRIQDQPARWRSRRPRQGRPGAARADHGTRVTVPDEAVERGRTTTSTAASQPAGRMEPAPAG